MIPPILTIVTVTSEVITINPESEIRPTPWLFFHRGLLQRAQMDKSGGLSSSESKSMTSREKLWLEGELWKMVIQPSNMTVSSWKMVVHH